MLATSHKNIYVFLNIKLVLTMYNTLDISLFKAKNGLAYYAISVSVFLSITEEIT